MVGAGIESELKSTRRFESMDANRFRDRPVSIRGITQADAYLISPFGLIRSFAD